LQRIKEEENKLPQKLPKKSEKLPKCCPKVDQKVGLLFSQKTFSVKSYILGKFFEVDKAILFLKNQAAQFAENSTLTTELYFPVYLYVPIHCGRTLRKVLRGEKSQARL
jgi:hypothetical protein